MAQGKVQKAVFRRFTLPTKVGYERFFDKKKTKNDAVSDTAPTVPAEEIIEDESDVLTMDEESVPSQATATETIAAMTVSALLLKQPFNRTVSKKQCFEVSSVKTSEAETDETDLV